MDTRTLITFTSAHTAEANLVADAVDHLQAEGILHPSEIELIVNIEHLGGDTWRAEVVSR